MIIRNYIVIAKNVSVNLLLFTLLSVINAGLLISSACYSTCLLS